MTGVSRPEVGVLAVAFALAGLVTLAIVWAGDAAYVSLADPRGAAVHVAGGTQQIELPALVDVHRRTIAYVLSEAPALPDLPGRPGVPLFDESETSHMRDVRTVFGGARVVQLGAFVVIAAVLLLRRTAGRAALLRAVRAAAVGATGGTAVVALAAAVAFDRLFLLFHEVFFPQGNFLFDPRSSNLLAVYPEPYWEGITLRIGGSFVLLAAAAAIAATATLRRHTISSR